MYRGSRKHVLDWTGRPSFPEEFVDLLGLPTVFLPETTTVMPRGVNSPEEARLETFGPGWLPGHRAWSELQDWWLCRKAGANTPNWDIALGCEIEGRPGLVLVEAKGNWPELGTGGKGLSRNPSEGSRLNHERIAAAIGEACRGWCFLDNRISIDRDTHYQLANRLAFIWKLATFGIPVILLYLGFTGDEGIRNVGQPFADDADWQNAFRAYISGRFPIDMLEKRLVVGMTPVWLMSRSRPILEMSPRI